MLQPLIRPPGPVWSLAKAARPQAGAGPRPPSRSPRGGEQPSAPSTSILQS